MNTSQHMKERQIDRQTEAGYWSYRQTERMGIRAYSSRTWQRRLPAVLVASVLLVAALFGAGIPLEAAAILIIVPILIVPLIAGLALSK